MRAFFLRHRKLHLWLTADLAVLVLFWLCRGNRAWMNGLAEHVTRPLRRALGRLWYRVDFSVMELLCVLAVLTAAGYLVWSVIAVALDRGHRRSRMYAALLGAVCGSVTVYVGFCLLWGVDSAADGFQDRSGVCAQPVAVEDLYKITLQFAQGVRETAEGVARDENGVFAVPREDLFPQSVTAYDHVAELWPFLAFADQPVPKAVHFSRFMSALDFTGVYCPFTGEANVNVDSPACFLPVTLTHEISHQRGITSEQECNFLAVLAATTCGDPAYAYSGYLFGYLYLGNALYTADRTLWESAAELLPPEAWADLSRHSEYWAAFEGQPAQKVSNEVYDRFLKSYGQELGLQSYGTVVDLLVSYYK